MPICLNWRQAAGGIVGPPSTYYLVKDSSTHDYATGTQVMPLADCKAIAFTGAEYAQSMMLAPQSPPPVVVDPVVAAQYWGYAFAFTISIWALSYGAGQLIKLVKDS